MIEIVFQNIYLSIFILPVIILYIYIFFIQKKVGTYIPTFKIFKKYHTKNNLSLDIISLFTKLIVFILLIITIMRPQQVIYETKEEKEAIDIFIVLDISLSMMAEDLLPNRMEAAKETIKNFLTKIDGNRIGMIIFAGVAFVQAPLTFDYKILYNFISKTSISTINQQIMGMDGTAIGDAIFTATEKLKKSDAKNKVIILLTDGEANRGADPIIASTHAKENNIKIYAIGIGDPNGAIIPTYDTLGRKTYLIGPDGEPLKTKIDIETLQEITDITLGKFFLATDNEKFQKAFEEITNLEKTKIKTLSNTIYKDMYQYPLSIAIILLIIDFLWFERKKITNK